MRSLWPVLFLGLAPSIGAAPSHWPQFRGPNASGIAEGFATPASWNMATGENVLWRTPIPGMAHASPIVWGDRVYAATAVKPGKAALKVGLYGCTDYGLVTCFEARTGRILFSERLRGANQGFTASPVAADGRLYFTGELGDVFVLAAGDTFSVLATSRLAETCLSTPAISEGCLFFRTREHLVAVGARR